MKRMIFVCLAALLSACSVPSFVGDAPPVAVTSVTPEHFEFPARFAFARVVYGLSQSAGPEEMEIWTDLADRMEGFGSFAPLVAGETGLRHQYRSNLIETAREQRYRYLILVRMDPSSGSADVSLLHTGSGGVMATVQASASTGGQRGFWGGRIRNPGRLDRATLKIAKATAPKVEDMLRGAALRQR